MIFYIINFFNNQKIDKIGKCAVSLQLTIIIKMIIIIFINSFYYKILPWFLYISFGCDIVTMIFGFFSSYKRISMLLFIFFLLSLVLFLFDFIPLVLMNSEVWDDSGSEITAKDIFQSICEILWFSSEILVMHFARKQRSLLEQLESDVISSNNSIMDNNNNNINTITTTAVFGQDNHGCINSIPSHEKDKIKSSLFICVDGFQSEDQDLFDNQKEQSINSKQEPNRKSMQSHHEQFSDQQLQPPTQQPTQQSTQQPTQQLQQQNNDDHFISIDLSDSIRK
ncbi:hypothetical protein ACTFIU_000037 [Dictyostelium citrinum]